MLNASPQLLSQLAISPSSNSVASSCVLIVGASRGIGLALTEALLSQPELLSSAFLGNAEAGNLVVLAACRSPLQATELCLLQEHYPHRLALLAVDVASQESMTELAQQIRKITPSLRGVINTVGMLHEPASESKSALRPEKALSQVRVDALARSFAVNAWAPILLAQALLPLLPRQQPFVFASLSARVGSIGDNQLGGWYSYRAAKAAQNQFLKTWSIELMRTHPQATVLVLHPGTTDTDLSKPFSAHVSSDKLFTKERVARDLLAVIAARGPADSGGFFDWANASVPW